jgi:hypothetical protein
MFMHAKQEATLKTMIHVEYGNTEHWKTVQRVSALRMAHESNSNSAPP